MCGFAIFLPYYNYTILRRNSQCRGSRFLKRKIGTEATSVTNCFYTGSVVGEGFLLDMKFCMVLMIPAMIFAFEGRADSRVMLGGYVPFASSMQVERDGGTNTFSFAPSWGVGTSVPLEEIDNHFAPMLGLAFHDSGEGEDYKKITFYLLADLEMEWDSSWYFRYGLGFFATFINGGGGVVFRKNGTEEEEFHRPSENIISYNMALDLGWDYYFSRRWFVRMETFIFSIWDSRARDMSYMLVLGYKYRP